MKTKFFFNAVMAALVAAIFSMLMGCAGTGATVGGDPGTAAAELAEQLAVDINAIEAEKATVSGDTVTLTGGVRLENAVLIVPSSVTLDLTTGVVLELGDGAVLTVNGTVNATGHGNHGKGWVVGSLRFNEKQKSTINGIGAIRLAGKGRLLQIWNSSLTLDGVTIVGVENNDASLVQVGEGSEFVMKSGAITGNTNLGNPHSTDEPDGDGGGVFIWKGKFTMEGGEISRNATYGKGGSYGGGVKVGKGEGSVFTMTGGVIADNTVNSDGYSLGGGVHADGTFIMEGGEISGNTAVSTANQSMGGGVRVDGTFTMTGGTIYGKTAEGGKANSAENGATLYAYPASATKWGTGGIYTKGGASQTGGSDILPAKSGTDDTLIAVPGQ